MALTSEEKLMKETLSVFAEDYINRLTSNLKNFRKIATGDLIKSLDFRIYKTAFGTKFTIAIEALEYLDYVDRGRKPGKFPPLDAIRQWVRVKGIPDSATFPIARKIAMEGIKPTDVVSKSLNDVLNGDPFNRFQDNTTDWISTLVDELIENNDISLNKNNNITIK